MKDIKIYLKQKEIVKIAEKGFKLVFPRALNFNKKFSEKFPD